MKRILAFILTFVMLLTCASCASSIAAEDTNAAENGTVTSEGGKTETKTEEKGEIVIPEGFSVGYAKEKVNPPIGTSLGGFGNANDRLSGTIMDDLYLTCTAISDGENIMLLFASDSIHVGGGIANQVAKIAEKTYGIPKDNVIMNATHTHSGPSLYSTEFTGITKYVKDVYYPVAEEIIGDALRDLAPAEIQYASVQADGLNYVRRYVSKVDGSYLGKNIAYDQDPAKVAHETEADREMQVVRFTRKDATDVVLCNWQCHATHVGSETGSVVSSDFVGYFRRAVERDEKVNFIYMQGAAGNVVPGGRIKGDNRNSSVEKHGEDLAGVLSTALQSATPVSSGKVQVQRLNLKLKYSEEYRKAEKLSEEASTSMSLYAFSFGDICIGTIPGEWHDTLGMELKEKSPFAITLVSAYTNGCNGYFPADFTYDNGGYEPSASRHERGTSEMFRDELLRMLGELYPTRMS